MSRRQQRQQQAAPGGASHDRWSVASRVLAASGGAYTVASLLAAVMGLVLPAVSSLSRADSVLLASLLSFVVYTVIAVWVFSVRSAIHAWAGLLAAALVLGLVWRAMAGTGVA